MTERFKAILKARPAQRRRVVTYVLLLLLSYGSSVGIAHRHGELSTQNPSPITLGNFEGSTTVDVGQSSGAPEKPGECQICQFRQNLSNGNIVNAVLLQEAVTSTAVYSVTPLALRSITLSIRQGRAPPITS